MTKPDKNPKKEFTATEVMALIEDVHKEIKLISEGHGGLDKRLENIEVEIHGNSRRLDSLGLSTTVLSGKATRLEDAVSKLSKDLKETGNELKTRLTAVETGR